jgi:hypothetical protein
MTILKDDLGRTITIDYSTEAQQDTITQAGYGNQTLAWTVNWGLVTITGAHMYGGSGDCLPYQLTCDAQGSVFRVVTSIDLPNGLVHYFTYSGGAQTNGNPAWGQLAGMTLPTGASASYLYPAQPTQSPAYVPTLTQIFPLSSKTLTWTDQVAPGQPV